MRQRLCLVALCTLLAARGFADEPAGVALLRPDSLAGWEHAASPPAGWTIQNGKLSGDKNSTALLSGWTLGDFSLRFKWSAGAGGAWRVELPKVPGFTGPACQLGGGDGAGIYLLDRKLTGVEPVGAGTDGSHTAQIQRSGDKLSLRVDDKPPAQIDVAPGDRFGLKLSLASGSGSIEDLRLVEPAGEPIFNGRDTSGWWTPGKLDSWIVESGELICTNQDGNYLRSEKEFGNFTLSLEYKIVAGGNSGIGIRTARMGWPSGDGMELQILDQPGLKKDSTMSIYGNLEPLARADKPDQWNRAVVKADGRMISAWINGQLVQHANTAWLPELKHRHLQGWIGLQDHGGSIAFRNLQVLEAPAGLGLDEWYISRPRPGPAIVLDRLMNPSSLATSDAFESGVISRDAPAGGAHVLAELTGPGSLVRWWQSAPGGRLAFYFDGHEQPDLECESDKLFDRVPAIGEERQPLLLCLVFAKSLKIVVRDVPAARFRIEHVRFSSDTPVRSWSAGNAEIPRGWLGALDYRWHQFGYGVHREADPYPRVTGEPKNIEPGATALLASAEGAGCVNWLKLQADPQVLKSDELWLEVTVDGESAPAISAPARFLFPVLSDGRNHPNFLQTSRGGLTSMLAMPFDKGISVSAVNRGTKVIEKVGMLLSLDVAGEKNRADFAGRMRLRGVFQPAGSAADLINQTGAGRWIGFVYNQPAGAALGIAAFTVDGAPRDGWAMPNLDPLVGQPQGETDFVRATSGRNGSLAWRYLLLAPIDFKSSLVLAPSANHKPGDRLALFYLRK